MLPSVYAPKDFKRFRAVGDLVARFFDMIAPRIVPGISTADINNMARDFLRENGARSASLGYHGFPGYLCTSVNDVIVHGIPRSDVVLKEGDIVNVDLTAELKGFHADSSRMFAVGKISADAQKLIDVTRDAMNSAIAVCGPGVPLSEIGRVIEGVANANGYSVVRDFVGHGIGKNMHDDPQVHHYYEPANDKIIMQPGFVFTIEPMLNQGSPGGVMTADGWAVKTVDGKLSAQWEHTVGITEDGVLIFTEVNSL